MPNSLVSQPKAALTTSNFRDIIDARRKSRANVLLLDISGSMAHPCHDGRRRIDALREIVSDFPGVTRYVFEHECQKLDPGEEVPEPCGGTYMSTAFRQLKSDGISHAVLVTDGEPSEGHEEVLEAAKGLKLDILYVGPDEEPPEILKQLATQTGGGFGSGDLGADQKLLTEQIKGFLS